MTLPRPLSRRDVPSRIIVEYVVNMDAERWYLAIKSNWMLGPTTRACILNAVRSLVEFRHHISQPRPRNGNLVIALALRLQQLDVVIQNSQHGICARQDAAVITVLEVSYSRMLVNGDVDELLWEGSDGFPHSQAMEKLKQLKWDEMRERIREPRQALHRKPLLYGPNLSDAGVPFVRQSLLNAERHDREEMQRFLRRGADDQGPWW